MLERVKRNQRTEVVEGQVLPGNVSGVNKRCPRNVIARLDFAAGGPLLVAALGAFLDSDLIDHSVRTERFHNGLSSDDEIRGIYAHDVHTAEMERLGAMVSRG